MTEPQFFSVTSDQLLMLGARQANRRYEDRRKRHRELDTVPVDERYADHWVFVSLNLAEVETLVQLLKLACPDHAPALVPLLEELREGMERAVIIDEVGDE